MSPPPSESLSARAAVGYGTGDFALNLYWGALSFFLLYWYTDVVGLPPAVAGFVFFAGTFWDAVSDPTIGFLVGRVHSRWGRYRPFLLLGAVPLAASFALLLWVPPLDGLALTVALLAAHLLFRTAYTVVSVPYSALSARISQRSSDRTTLASYRMVAATAGSLLISAAGFPVVRFLGNGDERSGFFYLALLAGSIAVLVMLLCFAMTREPPERVLDVKQPERDYRWSDVLSMLRTNTAFLYLLAMIPLFSAAAALMQKSLVYYVKYGLEAHEQQHVVLFSHGLAVMAATPLWAYVARRWDRRVAWTGSTLLLSAAAVVMVARTPETLPAFLLLLLPMSIAFAAMGVLFWSMLPDTIEYGQWRNGFRAEALFFGVASFTQKMSIGLVAWLMGWALAVVGFEPAVAQSALTITTIKMGMTLAPATLLILCLVVLSRYPLNAKLHRRIREDLFGRDSV
ncbi:MAG: glycoside-pentoside-hexuronide (GPH):cation symporter [Pseudomonadota bacterium]